jgi:hypothetical protein
MSDRFEHIKYLELSLLNPEVRTVPEKLDQILSDDFIEIGQSGRLYNKRDIIDELEKAPPSTAIFFDFDIRALSDVLILATYKSTNATRTVQRYSLWEKTSGDWRILYHEAEVQDG